MAYLHRLIFVALVLLSSWLPTTSYASFPATQSDLPYSGACTTSPCYVSTIGFVNTQSYSTAAASQEAAKNTFNATHTPSDYYLESQTSTSFLIRSTSASYSSYSGSTANSGAPVSVTYSCPANSTLSGSSCTCSAGYSQSGSSCVDVNAQKCADAKGGVDLFTGFSSLPTFGASFCPSDGAASSCAATVSGGYCVIKGGVKTCTHEVTYTGTTCTPPAPSPTESPVPTPCKGTYGQVNGVDVCLPLGSDPSATVETSKKTETTVTPPDGNSPTVSSTDQSSSCTGSLCKTTTTTTTGPVGGPTTTTTQEKTESKDDFCKENPRSSQCITSSFSGSCSASFACDGDAIMCAMSREQHIRNCKLFDDFSSSEAALYASEKGKEGEQTSGLPHSESIAIGSSSFDTSDAIGGGSSCIADKSVTVAGHVVSIPFSSVCVHLAILGNILLVVSFLLAGRIVVRG
jgi:hypothetical protein